MLLYVFRKGRMSLEELVGHVDKSSVISIVVTVPGNPWCGRLLFNWLYTPDPVMSSVKLCNTRFVPRTYSVFIRTGRGDFLCAL